jgi:intracellular sulfur oxidation DsrE/DsrF family protein
MAQSDINQGSGRRRFIGSLAVGAAGIGASIAAPLTLQANPPNPIPDSDPEAVFSKLTGKHKMVFDATKPHDLLPFAWPRVFLMTNEATGSPQKDCNAVVVLRHDAIPYAFEDKLWEKYNFGEVFKADDPATKAPAKRNPFAKPAAGEYKVPGIGPVAIGINELQASGVIFVVCDAAMTVYSAALADSMKMDAAEIKKEWLAGLLPGITPVPSGVWALGRAQEKGCAYVFAG